VELIEADLPIEIVSYGLVPDSGGAGRRRGGLAFTRSFRLLADSAVLTVRSDRRLHRPYGLEGGEPGGGSSTVVRGGGRERLLPPMPMEAVALRRDDVVEHVAAGGGGFGPPCEREPELVLEDVLDEKVSAGAAAERYGVVLTDETPPRIDWAGTRAHREAARHGR
jgi:N-methylhydantoinase B